MCLWFARPMTSRNFLRNSVEPSALTGLFFLDLPGREQKQSIWRMYLELFGIDVEQRLPDDQNWTGAEIRACCRLAALLDVPLVQAAQNIVPVALRRPNRSIVCAIGPAAAAFRRTRRESIPAVAVAAERRAGRFHATPA